MPVGLKETNSGSGSVLDVYTQRELCHRSSIQAVALTRPRRETNVVHLRFQIVVQSNPENSAEAHAETLSALKAE